VSRELFLTVLVVSSALDAAVAVVALRWMATQADGKLTLPTLVRAGASVTLVQILKLPLLVLVGVDKWGVMHLVYLDLVVVLPFVAVAALAMMRRGGATRPARIVALAAAGGCPAMGLYASFIEPHRLQFERIEVPIPEVRAGDGPVTIGVLADIQTDRVGTWEHDAVDRLLEARPDVIVIPGDLFQGWAGTLAAEREPLQELLARLEAPGGVFFVPGNTEWRIDVPSFFADLDIKVLLNEVALTSVAGRRLTIGGLADDGLSRDARAVIQALELQPGEADVRLLLSHRPDAVLAVSPGSRIDLIIAGHTHGGQVQVPFLGPPITLSSVPRRVAGGGLHDLDGRRIYVSRGLGRERVQAPSIRVLCPPEITLLTLE
jgi:predicted MPP superfamily phosphohydrolase